MPKVFVLGDLNLDILCKVDENPTPGEEYNINSLNFSIGGNAANFAVALGKLGAKPELIAAIGNDFSIPYLMNELEKSGVEANFLELDAKGGYSVIFVNPDGERAILSHKGAAEELTSEIAEQKILERAQHGDLVYIGGYFHVLKLHENFENLLKELKQKGAVTMFDICFDKFGFWMQKTKTLLQHIDFLFLNEVELEKLSGEEDIEKAISKLKELGAKNIVLKLGKDGCMFCSDNEVLLEKSTAVDAVDTTGAGDVFNAGFVFGYLKNLEIQDCLRLGNFVAGTKVQNHGLVLPTQKEISEFLKSI